MSLQKLVIILMMHGATYGLHAQQSIDNGSPDVLFFGHNYETQYVQEMDAFISFFTNSSQDRCFVFNENLELLGEMKSPGWSFLSTPAYSNGKWYTISSSPRDAILSIYSNDFQLYDSIDLGLEADHVYKIPNSEELMILQEYPFLVSADSALQGVSLFIYDVEDREVISALNIARKYHNLSGALWTNNIDIDYYHDRLVIGLLDPLSNEVDIVFGDEIHSWRLESASDSCWCDLMSHTFELWKDQYKPSNMKYYLGFMMQNWQSMRRCHYEQIFIDQGLIGLVRTSDLLVTIEIWTINGTFLHSFELSDDVGLPFLGKKVDVQDCIFHSLSIVELDSSELSYVKQAIDLSDQSDSIEICIANHMLCRSCLTREYEGHLLLRSSSAINDRILEADLLREFPHAKIHFYESIDESLEVELNKVQKVSLRAFIQLFSEVNLK